MPRSYRGIASKEDFGTTTHPFSGLFLLIGAIGSQAFVNGPTLVKKLQFTLSAGNIPSGEATGAPTVVPGGRSATPPGIAGAEAFGTARTLKQQKAFPTPVSSAYASGSQTLYQQKFALPASVATAAAVGSATLIRQPILSGADHAVMDPLGGHTLNLTGLYLDNISAVLIGGTSCAFTSNTSTSVAVTTPAKTFGNYSIVVVTPGGTSNQLSIESWDPLQLMASSTSNYWDSRYNLVTSGANVTSWTDRNNGVVANGSGGTRPTKVAASLGASPAVLFDGVDDVLTLGAGNTQIEARDTTVFWVGKWPAFGGSFNNTLPDVGNPVLGDALGETGSVGMENAQLTPAVVGPSSRGSSGGHATGFGPWVLVDKNAVSATADNAAINVMGLENVSAVRGYANGAWSSASGTSQQCAISAIGKGKTNLFKGSLGVIVLLQGQGSVAQATRDANAAKLRDWAQITFGAM